MKRLWFGLLAVTILTLVLCATTSTSAQSEQSPPPGYTGPIAHRPGWNVGDTWEYDQKRGWKLEEVYHLVRTVTAVTPTEIIVSQKGGKGRAVNHHYTHDLNYFKTDPLVGPVSRVEPDRQIFNWPLFVGKAWSRDLEDYPSRHRYATHVKVEAFEKVRLASGQEIEVFRLSYHTEYPSRGQHERPGGYSTWTIWYAPTIKNVVRLEVDGSTIGKVHEQLTDYKVTSTSAVPTIFGYVNLVLPDGIGVAKFRTH